MVLLLMLPDSEEFWLAARWAEALGGGVLVGEDGGIRWYGEEA